MKIEYKLSESIIEVERVAELVEDTQPVWSGHLMMLVAAAKSLLNILDQQP